MIDFEWNPDKAAENLKKHRVSFSEAASVFADPLAITIFDPDHSDNEERFLLLGHSTPRRLIVISHTDRSGIIRLISARLANRGERLQYESKH